MGGAARGRRGRTRREPIHGGSYTTSLSCKVLPRRPRTTLRMFLYWRNGEQRFPRGLLGLAFDGCLVALLPEAEADIYLPAGQKTEHFRPCRLP
ncbi:hypothetical protein XCCB100_2037 [Xanthomonas campestris pv. campestris]|uniref:Uncharacterized protein n=1 Tax=Xanthomonas campestris pv. campestris (strain B100) TaxID=509169 RepID=B0RSF5_XANCB|nr:hypothetical protein XCCB100_2037 [Xanthomonas campestris pv. campestris]